VVVMKGFNYKKAVQALNTFAKLEGGEINYMKAVKLIWLADRLHIRTYGRTITNDLYVAMKNGTVPSGTKDIVLKSGFSEPEVIAYSNQYLSQPTGYIFKSLSEVDEMVFSKTDIKIMQKVYAKFKDFTQFDLSDFSHQFPEWKRFEKELNAGVKKAFPIEDRDFFNRATPDEGELFAQSVELLALSEEHFYLSA
jgi:uncharacterized phage-associated protein